jgi:hypothetical protein
MLGNKNKDELRKLLIDVSKIACGKDNLEDLKSKDYQKIVQATGNKFSVKSIETWCSKIYPYEHNLNILSYFVLDAWHKSKQLNSNDGELKELLEKTPPDEIENKSFFKEYLTIINREEAQLPVNNLPQVKPLTKKKFPYSLLFLLLSFCLGFLASKWFSQQLITKGEILLHEKIDLNNNTILDDIEIDFINVLALDNLVFSADELEKLNKFGFYQSFHTLDNCNNCPTEQISFKRINQVFTTINAQPHFSTEERKKVFLSEKYLQMKKEDPNLPIYVFPKERQYSVVILKIIGSINKDGKIKIVHDSGNAIYDALSVAANGNDLIIPVDKEGNAITVLLFKGEELAFETEKFHWNLKVKNLFDPLGIRTRDDAALLSWEIKEKT